MAGLQPGPNRAGEPAAPSRFTGPGHVVLSDDETSRRGPRHLAAVDKIMLPDVNGNKRVIWPTRGWPYLTRYFRLGIEDPWVVADFPSVDFSLRRCMRGKPCHLLAEPLPIAAGTGPTISAAPRRDSTPVARDLDGSLPFPLDLEGFILPRPGRHGHADGS